MNIEPPSGRRTQIVATLGPASSSAETIAALTDAGMDVARLNFSHASHDEVATLVVLVRGKSAGRRLPAILADLQGRKLRVGELVAPRQLVEGDSLVLTRDPSNGDHEVGAAEEAFAPKVVQGTSIYLKDGVIALEVVARSASRIETVVRAGGELTSRAGLSIPGLDLGLPALTSQDRADLKFAVAQGVEWVAMSFVGDADDVAEARAVLRELNAPHVRVVAKIERKAALDQLDAIAAASDALMVARGDLGVEIGVEEVPVAQRRIIAASARRGIPAIVATEMLESMRTRERPTRAEASDVAHGVWDGAAALMLSAETAVGERPIEVVATMDRIIRRAEAEMEHAFGG